jgi:hypothetical protein
MNDRLDLVISKTIGEPINTQLPVPVAIERICNLDTAEAGEHVYRLKTMDEYADVVLAVDATNGTITVKKKRPLQDVELTFSGYNSKLEYVLVEEILTRVDTKALARRKAAISRGMDKYELELILNAILSPANTYFPYDITDGVPGSSYKGPSVITAVTADDIYDLIMKAKQELEDYGDKFVLLCGSAVKNAIDTYDKDKANSLNYNVNLTQKLAELNIEVIKIFGKVANDAGETEDALLNTNKFILVAVNSTIASGKPIEFVRRKIPAEIAALMGASVDNAQRALMVTQTPMQVDFSGTSSPVLGYGVYGYESIIFCISNPKAIATCDATLAL